MTSPRTIGVGAGLLNTGVANAADAPPDACRREADFASRKVGYLTYGTDAANMLFHVVNERHRRHRAMVFTTNKPLKAWGSVLHDEDLAHAILDRVLERGRVLRLDGPSIRTRHLTLLSRSRRIPIRTTR